MQPSRPSSNTPALRLIVRGTTLLVLLLALLTPHYASLLPLLRDAAGCGMSCCKRSKCCCRNATASTPQWSSTSSCSAGCGQIKGLSHHVAARSPLAQSWIGALCDADPRLTLSPFARTSVVRYFSLYQRPPPVT